MSLPGTIRLVELSCLLAENRFLFPVVRPWNELRPLRSVSKRGDVPSRADRRYGLLWRCFRAQIEFIIVEIVQSCCSRRFTLLWEDKGQQKIKITDLVTIWQGSQTMQFSYSIQLRLVHDTYTYTYTMELDLNRSPNKLTLYVRFAVIGLVERRLSAGWRFDLKSAYWRLSP